jgi:protein-tyrosine phosphatase
MVSILRQLVSIPLSWHRESGLDFCYITPKIIVTSGPSSTYPQSIYRNPLDKLVKFLDEKHGKDWAIWELRAEGTGYLDSKVHGRVNHFPWPDHHPPPFGQVPIIITSMRNWLKGKDEIVYGKDREKNGRVVVVHCRAGKGRSGTIACSYLISECGWEANEALVQFTERRMRSGFGQGVSIRSQLRWIRYADRWTKHEKLYLERQIEIKEVHVWGMRGGVRISIKGYIQEGKEIKLFHTFTNEERIDGFGNKASELALGAGQTDSRYKKVTESDCTIGGIAILGQGDLESNSGAVIFKPAAHIILPTSDINITLEQRISKIITSVAYAWFNAFFEGKGLENKNEADVFEIDWDEMDGVKGSSQKGIRALDRLVIVWKICDPVAITT